MFTALIVVEIIISILLIVGVLAQASKGGGLAGTFGGGNVGMMFGVRRTADFLSNATWGLAIAFAIIAIIINVGFLPTAGTDSESILQRATPSQQQPAPVLPPTQAPTPGN